MRQIDIAARGKGLLSMGVRFGLPAAMLAALPTMALAQTQTRTEAQAVASADAVSSEPAPPDTANVPCPADGMEHCLQVPGVAVPPEAGNHPVIVPPPALWSIGVSGGLAPRDGGATGAYGAVELRRQIGHGYVQLGAMRYHTPLLSDAVSAASTFNVGTLAGGINLNNWLLDGYVSYGWQHFGAVRVDDGSGVNTIVRPSNGPSGSPYYAAGASVGKMIPVSNRTFITPTLAVVYAWGRWLRPAGTVLQGPDQPVSAGQDYATGEPTWTGTMRLRVDHMMGRARRSYLGVSLAGLWSSNATSFAGAGGVGGVGGPAGSGPGLPGPGANAYRLHDPWVEVALHGSLAMTRLLRAELTVARTAGLVSGDTTTINIGLRHQF
ncbi:hypothetical protein [Novosphingobium terrae]|uniref:hypothetical protein n=1 Tax=Novosphingobium terrae TaxID=2726189 RepID=UPI001981949A|nr:hypothetical protein [Novosphingobium terrae]